MTNHKSSAKRVRGDLKKTKRNTVYKSKVRTGVKKLRSAISSAKTSADVSSLFRSVQSVLAKAASKGIMPKNTVSRNIKRLSLAVKNIEKTTTK